MEELKNLLSMLKSQGVAAASFHEDGALQSVQFFPNVSDLSEEEIDLTNSDEPDEATKRLLNRDRGSYQKDDDE